MDDERRYYLAFLKPLFLFAQHFQGHGSLLDQECSTVLSALEC